MARQWVFNPFSGSLDAVETGISISGTPADNRIAVWTDANTLEGTTSLTYASGLLHVAAGFLQVPAIELVNWLGDTATIALDNGFRLSSSKNDNAILFGSAASDFLSFHSAIAGFAFQLLDGPGQILAIGPDSQLAGTGGPVHLVLGAYGGTFEFVGAQTGDVHAIAVWNTTIEGDTAQVIPVASSLYIEKAPTAGTNTTITTALALWVDDGNVRFDDDILWRSGTDFDGTFAHDISEPRTWTFPDKDGTVAMLSDVTVGGGEDPFLLMGG